jgi:MurNAc alpha-1-phosphate uridylyltransferase
MPTLARAMILAAGRGERMRPLSDATPKPLLPVGGKPLIAWQIEALARAGFRDIVINVAHRAEQMLAALGDGAAFGVRIAWSREPEPLETAGGIATASPLLAPGPALIVSGDIWTRFDYAALVPRMTTLAADASRRAHLVMVPNPPYHARGDFALAGEHLRLEGDARLTFGNIGVYDTALFRELPRGVKLKMLPLYRDWIRRALVSGERYDGPWANVGTPADLAALDAALAKSHERHEPAP